MKILLSLILIVAGYVTAWSAETFEGLVNFRMMVLASENQAAPAAAVKEAPHDVQVFVKGNKALVVDSLEHTRTIYDLDKNLITTYFPSINKATTETYRPESADAEWLFKANGGSYISDKAPGMFNGTPATHFTLSGSLTASEISYEALLLNADPKMPKAFYAALGNIVSEGLPAQMLAWVRFTNSGEESTALYRLISTKPLAVDDSMFQLPADAVIVTGSEAIEQVGNAEAAAAYEPMAVPTFRERWTF